MTDDSSSASKTTHPAAGLTTEERGELLRAARESLEAHLSRREVPADETALPGLNELRPAFVTLRNRDSGELRGCRGEVVAAAALVESVRRVAVAAATDDPRFPGVTLEELPEISIEINALGPMEPISEEDVEIGRHGLMIVLGPFSGLLLPEVPLDWGWDRRQFLENLCLKAGLPPEAWKEPDAVLYGFEAEVWKEGEQRHRRSRMEDQLVGMVTHYFARPGVAAVKLSEGVSVGDTLRFEGHTTCFDQKVTSIQIEHGPVDSADAGAEVGILVDERVRDHDRVYRVLA
jgi:AmmeMemoRadiSam system protein A